MTRNWLVFCPFAENHMLDGLSSIAFAAGLPLLSWLEKAATVAPSKEDAMLLSQVTALRLGPGTVKAARGGWLLVGVPVGVGVFVGVGVSVGVSVGVGVFVGVGVSVGVLVGVGVFVGVGVSVGVPV